MLFGIAQLDEARQREVLALRMPLKTIVGQDAAQVRIAFEQHAVHVEHFALQPASDRPDACDGRDRHVLIRAHMHANAVVLGQRQQAVNHLETRVLIRPVDARDFHQLLIGTVIAQGDHRLNEARRDDRDGDFAVHFVDADNILAKRLGNRVSHAIIAGITGGGMAHRVTVPSRRIFRCNCMMP